MNRLVVHLPALFGLCLEGTLPRRRSRTSSPALAALLIALITPSLSGQTSLSATASPAVSTSEEAAASGKPAVKAEEEERLADDYLRGTRIPKDPARAAYWYRRAADHGSPRAQNQLGYLYLTGTGLQKNEAEAAKWFARALAGGDQNGKINLALIYLEGSRRMRNAQLGVDLLNQLAEKGNGHAEDLLGVLYEHGEGVRQDRAIAEKWFTRSAKHGSPEGEYAVGEFNFVEPQHKHDFSKAAKFLRRSAHAGYVPAMYLLGILLVNHPEVAEQHRNEAIAMLTHAAEAGNWEASAVLGILARKGRGMRQDIGEAFRWFLIESRQGGSEAEESARHDIESSQAVLTSDQLDQERRAAEEFLAQHNESDLFVLSNGMTIPTSAVYLTGTGRHN